MDFISTPNKRRSDDWWNLHDNSIHAIFISSLKFVNLPPVGWWKLWQEICHSKSLCPKVIRTKLISAVVNDVCIRILYDTNLLVCLLCTIGRPILTGAHENGPGVTVVAATRNWLRPDPYSNQLWPFGHSPKKGEKVGGFASVIKFALIKPCNARSPCVIGTNSMTKEVWSFRDLKIHSFDSLGIRIL